MFCDKKQKSQRGFTLIELLVVISIIALLASVILVAFNNTRIKARDTKRIADIKQLQKALDLYYGNNGSYPVITTGTCATGAPWLACSNEVGVNTGWAQLGTALVPYISALPKDPKQDPTGWPGMNGSGNVGNYSYSYQSWINCNNQGYIMTYQLEVASGPDSGPSNCQGNPVTYGGSGANTQVKTVGVNAR